MAIVLTRTQSTRSVLTIGTALAALASVASTAFVALHGGVATAAVPPAMPSAVTVTVATVVQAPVVAWEDFSGRLEAVDRVDIRSRVSGALQSIHFREGALVKAGDLLVTIDPAPYAAEVERSQAQVAAAQARLSHQRGDSSVRSGSGRNRPSRSANSMSAPTACTKPRPI